MTIKEAGNGIVLRSSRPISYVIGFANGDETELDARNLKELSELWESLCPEFGCEVDEVDYIERAGGVWF